MTGATTLSSIRPFHDAGDILGPTLKLFFGNLWLITKIVIVIVAPFEVFRILNLENFPDSWQLTVGVILLDHVCKVLIAPALIYALMKVMQTGVAPGINESYRWGCDCGCACGCCGDSGFRYRRPVATAGRGRNPVGHFRAIDDGTIAGNLSQHSRTLESEHSVIE
jgi:hypothetical protein